MWKSASDLFIVKNIIYSWCFPQAFGLLDENRGQGNGVHCLDRHNFYTEKDTGLKTNTLLYFGQWLVLSLIQRSCLRTQNEDTVHVCIFRSSPQNEYCTISIDIYKISHMAKQKLLVVCESYYIWQHWYSDCQIPPNSKYWTNPLF